MDGNGWKKSCSRRTSSAEKGWVLLFSKRFLKEADGTGRTVFRSTLLAPDRRMLAGSGIPELTREIATILKLEGYEETAE